MLCRDKLYLSTAFAIVEYDINELEFGDTFLIEIILQIKW